VIEDVGIKKGEKVDYAILIDGKPAMLFECKWCGASLENVHMSQLFRYFAVTTARIGILTNGITYHFHSDLDEPNKMDQKPFLVFDMLNIEENLVKELKKLSKGSFNLDEMLSSASDLKYTREIKRIFANELASPSDDFVRFLASQVYPGRMTQNAREMFTNIVKRAYNQFINEKINERLQSAMQEENATSNPSQETAIENVEPEPLSREDRIETTTVELEAFYIVKGILCEIVPPERVAMRDTISYCGVLLDDNNRKPICRFHFNSEDNKQISLFDAKKNARKISINNLNEIYKHAEELKKIISYYDV
jgi:hypothetical protein